MNLKANLARRRRRDGDNLEMRPVMNLFLILVPFLLFTASFVNIAILEMSLPQLNQTHRVTRQKRQLPKQAVLNTLAIRTNGFQLKSPTFKFPFIPRQNRDFDYERLIAQLRQVKQKFPDSEDVVIAPEDQIKYDTVIQVMDRCRETGFPNISISG